MGFQQKLLKASGTSIVESVTQLFNLCLKSGLFPSDWEFARVIPIPKAGNPEGPSNCRPISMYSHYKQITGKACPSLPFLVNTLKINIVLVYPWLCCTVNVCLINYTMLPLQFLVHLIFATILHEWDCTGSTITLALAGSWHAPTTIKADKETSSIAKASAMHKEGVVHWRGYLPHHDGTTCVNTELARGYILSWQTTNNQRALYLIFSFLAWGLNGAITRSGWSCSCVTWW